ncbi:uncharacterized protein LOC135842010 [Planococcus citri]|uniref:uncharacterized protein LOC135842010 n=1 Tax=Planococcus citri TaxID=170843 RepID=UPI0031F76EDF
MRKIATVIVFTMLSLLPGTLVSDSIRGLQCFTAKQQPSNQMELIRIKTGKPLELSCIHDSSVRWTHKDENDLNPDTESVICDVQDNTATFAIAKMSHLHIGSYSCQSFNSSGRWDTILSFYVVLDDETESSDHQLTCLCETESALARWVERVTIVIATPFLLALAKVLYERIQSFCSKNKQEEKNVVENVKLQPKSEDEDNSLKDTLESVRVSEVIL